MIRRTLYEALLAMLIAVIVSMIAYVLRLQTLPLLSPDAPAGQEHGDTQAFSTIEFEAAVEMFHNQAALFADARPRTIYLEGHIQGAISLDPYAFDQWSGDVMERFPLDQTIITYCDGPQCPLSTQLAEKLTWLGFENVFGLKDGWALWQQAGLPIASGE
jgi:rhodanese-related sulfurtransferase